jgi:D-glycero-D-manno-heptose 1,7-bisphosphate phosphatase
MTAPTPPTPAVILCGGRGERLRPLTDHLPKPMAPVLGRPFLEYLIEQLSDAGLKRFLLLTGYLSHQIADHFGRGEQLGVDIDYAPGPSEWDTGRRLAEAAAKLDERFVLLYGDNFAPFALQALWQRHCAAGLPVTLTVATKSKGNIRLGENSTVAVYDPSRAQANLTHVEIGYMIAERDPVLALDPARLGSFSRTIESLAAAHQLNAFFPGCSYRSISDLPRLRETEEFLRPRRLLLVDRDGVINVKAPEGQYVTTRDAFTWIPETVAALEQLAAQGFEFIILSNQACIGRGLVSRESVDALHAWMTAELARRDIRVLDVFICPHHWLDNCSCRKPNPGLFFQASDIHRFWPGRTLYVGDDVRDVRAAHNAGCPSLLIGPHDAPDLPPHEKSPTFLAAVPSILKRFQDWESTAETQRAS